VAAAPPGRRRVPVPGLRPCYGVCWGGPVGEPPGPFERTGRDRKVPPRPLDRHSARPLSGADGSRGKARGNNREHGEDDPNGTETVAAPATVSGEVLSFMPLVFGPGRLARPSTREPGDLPSNDVATGRGVPGSAVTPCARLPRARADHPSLSSRFPKDDMTAFADAIPVSRARRPRAARRLRKSGGAR
jgi:hypothetical protein